MSTQLTDILQLTVAERIQLVADIWDSIASVPKAIPLTETERKELDRRLSAYRQNPADGISWDQLKSIADEG